MKTKLPEEENLRKKQSQTRMLAALANNSWIVILACREAGISRQTHYNWKSGDPEYRRQFEKGANEAQLALNRLVSGLIRREIRSNNKAAIEATRLVYSDEVIKRVMDGEDYEFNYLRN